MEFILTFLWGIVIPAVFIIIIYKYISGKRIVSTDEKYSQRGVTINFIDKTISIGKHQYNVNRVTGINWKGVGRSKMLEIHVDDLRKPIHRVTIVGSEKSANDFMQRVCVALRKADGPSFI